MEDFLAAWNYLESLGTQGSTLRQGVAQTLVQAHGANAKDFMAALDSHPNVPSKLRGLVRKKIEELEAASGVG